MSIGFLALMGLVPIIAVFLLLVAFHVPTHLSAIIGWAITVAVAMAFFNTSFEASMLASLEGVISSLGITILIAASVFQISFMEETGAIERIVAFVKGLAPDDEYAQTMTIANGTGTVLVSIGATPVGVLPPVFKGLGYSDFLCVALPAIGFLGLDAYGFLSICMVAVCGMTGMDIIELNKVVVLFLPFVSTAVAFAMLWLVGKGKAIRKGWGAALVAGLSGSAACALIAYVPALQGAVLLSGIFGGLVVMLCELLYVKARGQRLFDEEKYDEKDRAAVKRLGLGKALSPWILMIILLCIVYLVPPISGFLQNDLACPVSVIPGSVVNTRPFYNAYTWLVVGTLLSAVFLKPNGRQWRGIGRKFAKRAPKPLIAVCMFYALGILMNKSGIDPAAGWVIVDKVNNIPSVLAMVSVDLLGAAYPVIVAPLTVFGAFITSSQTSACIMFANYFIEAGNMLGMSFYVFIATAVIAGGVAGVISPAKLLNASSVIGAEGADQEALGKCLLPTILIVVLQCVLCFVAVQLIPPLLL